MTNFYEKNIPKGTLNSKKSPFNWTIRLQHLQNEDLLFRIVGDRRSLEPFSKYSIS